MSDQPRFWTRPNSGKVYDRSLPVGGDGSPALVAMFYANGTTNPDQEAADAYVAWRNSSEHGEFFHQVATDRLIDEHLEAFYYEGRDGQ